MPDLPISGLGAIPTIADADLIAIVDNTDGVTKKGTQSQIKTYIQADVLLKDGSVALTANWDAGAFKITALQIESDIVTGTAPFIVASSTKVASLNVDQVDGFDLDQDVLIASSPTHVGLTLSGLALANGIVQTDAAGVLSSTAKGNLTETTSSVLTITGGTNAIIGTGLTIEVDQADTSNDGYLSSTDWNTFNNKEPAITTLPISKGGTNSGTALTNGKIMVSSGGAIVESSTITTAASVFSAEADTDAIISLGRAAFASPVSDVMYLSHFDRKSEATNYALKQLQDGTTSINSRTTKNLNFCISNGTKAHIEADGTFIADIAFKLATGATVNSISTTLSAGSLDTELCTAKAAWDAIAPAMNVWTRVTGTPNYVLPTVPGDDVGATAARITKGWFSSLDVSDGVNTVEFFDGTYTIDSSDKVRAVEFHSDDYYNFAGTDSIYYTAGGTPTWNMSRLTADDLIVNGNALVTLGAAQQVRIDADTTAHTSAQAFRLDYKTAISNTNAFYIANDLAADINNFASIKALITSTYGITGANEVYGIESEYNGNASDNNGIFRAFVASPVTLNGGTMQQLTAFAGSDGYDMLLLGTSGDIIFRDYAANINAERLTSGAGYDLTVAAGDGVGTDQDGGDLNLNAGNPTGSGAHGMVKIESAQASTIEIGKSSIFNPSGDLAAWGHRQLAGATNYAIKQSLAGITTVNSASGQNLNFAINDVAKAKLQSDGKFQIDELVLASGADVTSIETTLASGATDDQLVTRKGVYDYFGDKSSVVSTEGTKVTNVTGDGTVYTCLFDEVKDLNSEYNPATGIITFKQKGVYVLTAIINLNDVNPPTVHTSIRGTFNSSVATVNFWNTESSLTTSVGDVTINGSLTREFDVNDTVKLDITVQGSSQVVDVDAGSYFTATLLYLT